MRKDAASVGWAIVVSSLLGCSTMRSPDQQHPGIVDRNPNAVTRVFPASATRTAWAMAGVMAKDSILDDVQVMVDPQSNESRTLSASEREKLGISRMKVGTHDMNYDITAKSKDNRKVGVVIQLKGESSAEVTLLYGSAGDPELSKSILDEVALALEGPVKDPGVWKASATKPSAKKAVPR